MSTHTEQRIRMTSALDVHTAADLRQQLITAFQAGHGVLLDFGGHPVHDTTGIGLLVEAHRRAFRSGCRLRITGVDDRSLRMLQRIGVARALGLEVPGHRAHVARLPRLRVA